MMLPLPSGSAAHVQLLSADMHSLHVFIGAQVHECAVVCLHHVGTPLRSLSGCYTSKVKQEKNGITFMGSISAKHGGKLVFIMTWFLNAEKFVRFMNFERELL